MLDLNHSSAILTGDGQNDMCRSSDDFPVKESAEQLALI
jgi:hypothetical protein